jgi:hypothetical protein
MADRPFEGWRPARPQPPNRTGRRRHGPRFVSLPHYLLDSQAWRWASLPARAAFVELVKLYNGANNGRLALAARDLAARLRCSRATAARALIELERKGFIECTKLGAFSLKQRHASEYRLTLHRCDVSLALPTKAFMRWQPGNGLTHETEKIKHGLTREQQRSHP